MLEHRGLNRTVWSQVAQCTTSGLNAFGATCTTVLPVSTTGCSTTLNTSYLNPDNFHRYALQYVYLPRINQSLSVQRGLESPQCSNRTPPVTLPAVCERGVAAPSKRTSCPTLFWARWDHVWSRSRWQCCGSTLCTSHPTVFHSQRNILQNCNWMWVLLQKVITLPLSCILKHYNFYVL